MDRQPRDRRHARRDRITELDPRRDFREIANLFLADFETAIMMQVPTSLMTSFAVPRMSRLLESTGQFSTNFTKRFVDQGILGALIMREGFDTPGRGRDALRRMNTMHHRYDIHPDDFRFIASVISTCPLRLAQRYGWREVSEAEVIAVSLLAHDFTRGMGIRGFPTGFDEQVALFESYADEMAVYEPQNRRLTEPLMAFFRDRAPAVLRPVMEPLVCAVTDPRIVRACGYRVPPAPVAAALRGLMGTIARADPLHSDHDGLADLIAEAYPDGLDIATMGTHVGEPDAETSVRPGAPGGVRAVGV